MTRQNMLLKKEFRWRIVRKSTPGRAMEVSHWFAQDEIKDRE
jgi:hypothetical protein